MNISSEKVSNAKVKPLAKIDRKDDVKVKGADYLPDPDCVCLYCSRRKSGKSTTMATCVYKTTTKRTVFFIFSPTHNVDETMTGLIENLKKRGNQVNVYSSLFDGKIDRLDFIMKELLKEESESEEEKSNPSQAINKMKELKPIQIGGARYMTLADVDNHTKEPEKKEKKKPKYKPKYKAPEYCFIIDDLGTELIKSKGLVDLCFNGRHIHASLHISFQYKNSLPPKAWEQCSYLFIFKNFNKEKLKDIYESLDLKNIDNFEQFFDIYKYATQEDNYPFLLCDIQDGIYRERFNKRINFEKVE